MEVFLHDSDAVIERKNTAFGGPTAELKNEEGCKVFEFPAEFTDDQIRLALRLANQFYARGITMGKIQKAHEIKACLGIS